MFEQQARVQLSQKVLRTLHQFYNNMEISMFYNHLLRYFVFLINFMKKPSMLITIVL